MNTPEDELRGLPIPELLDRLVSTYMFAGHASGIGELEKSQALSRGGELIQRILLEKVMELQPPPD